MKYKLFLTAIAGCILVVSSCKKDAVTSFSNGSASAITSSTATVAPTAADSTDTVVVFSWTNPNYATDSGTVRYTFQIDTSASFLHPVSFASVGTRSLSLTGKEVDSILLGYGLSFNTTYQIYLRVISSYSNYNDQKISDAIHVTMKAYVVPPKVTPPSTGTLFIIGDATAEVPQWSNSSSLAPVEQFTQIDSVTYGGIFYLTSTGSYLFLPSDIGDWSHKFGGASATGGTLLVDGDVPGSNTPAPATSGYYKIIVNFQTGTYSVTPYTNTFTGSLFIIGDATNESPQWDNSANLATSGQQFTQLDNGTFQLTLPLNNTGSYLLLPSDVGDWSHKYGGTSATGGTLLFDGDVPGSNTPPPAVSGTYTITVNFVTGMYTVQ